MSNQFENPQHLAITSSDPETQVIVEDVQSRVLVEKYVAGNTYVPDNIVNVQSYNDLQVITVGIPGTDRSSQVVVYSAFIDEALGGETTLTRPAGAPPIPNSEKTQLFIDGRKVRRSHNGVARVFTVSPDGEYVTFLPLVPGQDVELQYSI